MKFLGYLKFRKDRTVTVWRIKFTCVFSCNCCCDGHLAVNNQLLQSAAAVVDVVGVAGVGDGACIGPAAVVDGQCITGISLD